MQSKIPAEATVTTYLEYFKAINVQHSDVKLLMVLHHGFVDGLKLNVCARYDNSSQLRAPTSEIPGLTSTRKSNTRECSALERASRV